jgi:hypothetical protein
MFTVTKQFTTGLLSGLTVTETTQVELPVGFVSGQSSISPSAYVVIASKKVGA